MALMSLSLEYEFPWNWEDDAVNDVEDMEIFKEKEVTTSGEETTTENPDFEDDNGSGEENNFEEEGTGIAQLSGFISFLNTSALPEIPPAPTPKVLRHQLDLLEDIHMESIKFYLFAFLPAEIRLQIWRCCAPRPRIIHINYDVNRILGNRYNMNQGFLRDSGWEICNPSHSIAVRDVCQEARFEVDKIGSWEMMSLACDVTERTLINWETDMVFLNTNATDLEMCNVTAQDSVPLGLSVSKKLRHLALASSLGFEWQFSMYYGEDVSCDVHGEYSSGYMQGEFDDDLRSSWGSLEDFWIVENGDMLFMEDDKAQLKDGWIFHSRILCRICRSSWLS